MEETTLATVEAWAESQLRYWEKTALAPLDVTEYFDRLNAANEALFVFVIRDGTVFLLPKSERSGMTLRALRYREFLSEVAREYCPTLSCTLAMSMDDMAMDSATLPLFAFQKPEGSHAVLLPDIDALIHDFYKGAFDDEIPYAKKIDQAVFVGSTTGNIHTEESVARLSSQRLRLGVYYRDDADVIFNLPSITQCDSAETEKAIRALGLGVGAMDWAQQLHYKFLISVDGNGATCSRMAIALKSHSVLLKFDSPHRLYYFDGLDAHRHYVPIADPADVATIIGAERMTAGLYESVAAAGSEFYERYLTKTPAMQYTASLLRRYARLFPEATDNGGVTATDSPGDVRAYCIAHIGNRGDAAFDLTSWVGDPDGHGAIEGFQIAFHTGLVDGELLCGILTTRTTSWVQQTNDNFIGSRSQSTPIIGLEFALTGPAADLYDCLYSCAFADGVRSAPHSNGQRCMTDERQPIHSFRLAFRLKAFRET